MIELSGLRVKDETFPDGDIAIKFTGLRPGEKLYEELLISANDQPTSHPLIRRAQEPKWDLPNFDKVINKLVDVLHQWDDSATCALINELVPELKVTNND